MAPSPFPDPIPPELDAPPGRWHGRLWVSKHAVVDSYPFRRALGCFPESGYWPVLVPPDERFVSNGEDWIDRAGLAPCVDEVDSRSVQTVLADWWPGHDETCSEYTAPCFDPFGARCPAPARRSSRRTEPVMAAASIADVLAIRPGTRLGLVPVSRSADVPAVLGWSGAINHTQDVAALSAVLRSWEDRFGTRLIGLGFDELVLSVAAPPTSEDRALRVAAEHTAFCPDGFFMQRGTVRDVARGLVGRRHWRFWWD